MRRLGRGEGGARQGGEAPQPVPAAGAMHPAPGMGVACEGVSFRYEEAKAAIPALRDVSFAVPAGGSVAVLGASGAGKSTLLQIVRGLDPPESGVVRLDGLDPVSPGYADAQRRVGLVFQLPELQLFASSAGEDAAFGPRRLGWPEAEVQARPGR